MDFNSFPIWHEYVNFLKSVSAPGAYAENQKITAVRKVYQNAIVTPMLGIETLWKEYMAYEQSINKILSEKIIIDRSKEYMNARRVAKELEVMTKGVLKNAPSVLPTGTPDEIKQVTKIINVIKDLKTPQVIEIKAFHWIGYALITAKTQGKIHFVQYLNFNKIFLN